MDDAKEYEKGKEPGPDGKTNAMPTIDDEKHASANAQETTQVSLGLLCAHCGKSIPGDKRFCVYCGAPTGVNTDSISCPACGEAMPVGTLFCGACGMSLRASSPVSFSGTGTLSFGVPTRTAPPPEKRQRTWLGAGASMAVLLLVGIGILIGRMGGDSAPQLELKPPEGTGNGPEQELPKVQSPPPVTPLGGVDALGEKAEKAPTEPQQPGSNTGGVNRESQLQSANPPLVPVTPIERIERNPQPGTTGVKDANPEPPPPSAPPPDFLPGYRKVLGKRGVPIRNSPKATAKKLAVVPPGKEVFVVKTHGQWIEIRAEEGQVGYIPRDAVGTELVPEDEEQSAGPALLKSQ